MSWKRFFRRRQWDEERAREMNAYLEFETAENIGRGMPPDEARAAAHRKLGNATLVREEIYNMNTIGWIETLRQDVRYALRILWKSPGFTITAVVTLALGISASTAVFSLVNTILLKPPSYPNLEQVVFPWRQAPAGLNLGYNEIPWGTYRLPVVSAGIKNISASGRLSKSIFQSDRLG